MATRKWDDVRAELFTGREEEIRAAEEQLRDEVRAYRLAEIRKARHLTQQQVASEMGVTTARVSQIEHGQVDRAAIRGLAGYVEALGGHLELVANFGDERIVIGLWLSGVRNPPGRCGPAPSFLDPLRDQVQFSVGPRTILIHLDKVEHECDKEQLASLFFFAMPSASPERRTPRRDA